MRAISACYVFLIWMAPALASGLTHEEAIRLAFEKNPELQSLLREADAARADADQAGAFPNPEFSLEIENFGGNEELDGFDRSETTFQIGQLFELGGKRSSRQEAAKLDQDLTNWNYLIGKQEIYAAVSTAFYEALAAQEMVSVAEELFSISKRVADTVAEKVRAGKVSPIEETRAKISRDTSRTEKERAILQKQASRKRLSAWLAEELQDSETIDGDLYLLQEPPAYEDLEGRLARIPRLAYWDTEMARRQALLELAEANRIPDLTFSGGLRHLSEFDQNAFVAQFSLPLPLFNRYGAAVRAASHRAEKAKDQRRSAELQARSTLAAAHQLLAASHRQAVVLKEQIVPDSRSAFEAVQEGYREGKFELLDVLDAQRTYFAARLQLIQSLSEYHKAAAEVKRLTASVEEAQSGVMQ